MILFIHGFGSCGWGEKSLQLRRHFGVDQVLAPDLPIHPDRAMDTLNGLLLRYPVDAVVGSSLGGFFATCLNAAARLPGVLINPVVRPHELLADHLGAQRRWCDDAPIHVGTDFLPALARLQRERLAADERYLVLLQQGDEVLDYRRAEEFYAGKDVVSLPGGSHRFEGFENHLPRIADWLRLSDEHYDKDHQTTA